MKKKGEKTNSRNHRYFGPLIQSKVESDYLKIFCPLNTIFLSIFYFIAFYEKQSLIQLILAVAIGINIFGFFISFWKYNILSYFILGISFLTTILWIDLMSFIIFVSENGFISIEGFYNSPMTTLYTFVLGVVLLASLIIYIWHYLPQNRGKRWKFNQWGSGKEKSKFQTNFGIAFGAVVFVPALLTGYLQNIFGFFLGILLNLVMPALVVDSFYVAYHAYKYPAED